MTKLTIPILAAVLAGTLYLGISRNRDYTKSLQSDITNYLENSQRTESVEMLSNDSLSKYLDMGLELQRVNPSTAWGARNFYVADVSKEYQKTIDKAKREGTITGSSYKSFNSKLARMLINEAKGVVDDKQRVALPYLSEAWESARKSDSVDVFYDEISALSSRAAGNWYRGKEIVAEQQNVSPQEVKVGDGPISAYGKFIAKMKKDKGEKYKNDCDGELK
jgi:hypothetical protein